SGPGLPSAFRRPWCRSAVVRRHLATQPVVVACSPAGCGVLAPCVRALVPGPVGQRVAERGGEPTAPLDVPLASPSVLAHRPTFVTTPASSQDASKRALRGVQ